jgi:serine/threonine-protein kinase
VIGQTLGSYRIVKKLGEGGMGVVYVAEHPLIGRKAAVKQLLPEYCNNKRIVDRFFNEARAATMIQHAGIVQIFDFGYTEDGSAYIVMEFLEGEGLQARVDRMGRLPADQVLRFSRQAAGALGAAHDAGIIHRDLKPDNIHIVPDREITGGERVKVLDFGIAKLTGTSSGPGSHKTRTGAMMGSPMYMSPEQCRGAGEVDARADIYSLGCVMYHIATGRTPFEAEGVGEIIAKHIYEEPAPPRSHAPEVSPELEAIILEAIAKDPTARYQSMQELVDAIDAISRGRLATSPSGDGLTATVPPRAAVASPMAATTLGSAASEMSLPGDDGLDRVPTNRGWLIPVAAVVLIGGGAAVYAMVGGGGGGGDSGGDTEPIAGAVPASPIEPAGTPAHADAAPALEPAPPADPERVVVKLESEPSRADVYRVADGIKIGRTPFEQSFEKGAGELVVVLRRKGYESETLTLALDQDRTEKVTLDKASRRKLRPIATKAPTPPPPDKSTEVKKEKPRETKKGKDWGKTFNPLED